MNPRASFDGLGFDAEAFTSQQPQLFGPYPTDGSPLPPNMASSHFFTESDGLNSVDENDPKRRRVARACDMCRKKKIRCDGRMPCSHCLNYKTECVFTQVEKKRNPPKGAKYIEGLENRLGRMESLLKMSGLFTEEDAGKTDLGTLEKRLAEKRLQTAANNSTGAQSRHNSIQPADSTFTTLQSATSNGHTRHSGNRASASPSSLNPPPEGVKKSNERREDGENLSELMCSLVTNNCGETRYIGSSSALSIFSRKGIEWINEKTGDNSFQNTITNAMGDDHKWLYWRPDIFSDLFIRRVFKPLPRKAEAVSLFKDFFENFNCMIPLFHEPTFMHLVEKQYSPEPYEGSGWWASINVVLAIAHRLRVMSNLVPQDEDQKAWLYLKNAMGVLTELTMRNTDLLSVQALLGMALFLQGTPNPQPAFFLISAAIRLSHSIGLHKSGSGFNLSPLEAEQRKRVFWIAYCLDKDTCLRSGRPPAQDDDEMNVELPSEDPPDNIGNIPLADGKGKINLFRLMCEFATISSKVYKQLYSVRAAKQSDGELLNTIGELDQELEEWKDKIPIDFRPEHEIKASHTPLLINIVVLHFAYYNCLTTIHRMSVHHGYWTSRLSDYAIQGLNARPLNPRVFSSAALSVTAARASIHLIKYIPQGDFACVWLVVYFPISALVTLFANVLQNPQDLRARADLKLMNLVVNFLSILAADDENGAVRRMLGVCVEFERIAKVVLDKADKEGSRRKRKLASEEANQPPSSTMAQVLDGINPNTQGHPSNQGQSQKQQLSGATSFFNGLGGAASPSANGTPGSGGQAFPSPYETAGLSTDLADIQSAAGFDPAIFGGQRIPGTAGSPVDFGSFQQPFLPQDLWQMPMTFEWDWADMSNTGYPGFEQQNGSG